MGLAVIPVEGAGAVCPGLIMAEEGEPSVKVDSATAAASRNIRRRGSNPSVGSLDKVVELLMESDEFKRARRLLVVDDEATAGLAVKARLAGKSVLTIPGRRKSVVTPRGKEWKFSRLPELRSGSLGRADLFITGCLKYTRRGFISTPFPSHKRLMNRLYKLGLLNSRTKMVAIASQRQELTWSSPRSTWITRASMIITPEAGILIPEGMEGSGEFLQENVATDLRAQQISVTEDWF